MGRILLDAVSETILNFVFFLLKFAAWSIQWSVALVIFVAVMAASGYYVYTVTLQAGEPVQVPSIVNLPVNEAMIRLREQGLEMGKQDLAPHDTLPENHIISQRPAPGRVVRTGRKVYTTVSMGRDYLTAPDLANRYLENAREELETSQFRLGSVARVPDSKPRNMILAQDPPPGYDIEKGASIHLLVSDGDGQYRDYMPDLRGRPVSEIEAIMKPYNVTLVAQEVENMPGAREDVVLDQDPQPATLLFNGQVVTYKVKSSRPEPTPAPLVRATVSHEMRYDWYNRDVRIEQVDRDGNRTVLETFPASNDEVSRAARVLGSSLKVDVEYRERCRIDFYVDEIVVASYAIEDGQPPVRTTP